MPHPRIELKISKVVFGGDGLAEWNGKAVFVEGTLPGERVEAEIVEDKKRFARARTVRILEASPFRVDPACRYASRCGGCQYQHTPYDQELRLKQAQLEEIFGRSSAKAALRPIVPSESEQRYRSSLTLHPVRSASRGTTRLGLVGRDDLGVIPIDTCLLADPAFAAVYRREIPASGAPDRVTYKLDASGRIVDDLRPGFVRMALGGAPYLVPAGGFFQTNPGVASRILQRVTGEIAAFRPDTLFDLYAGVGTFGLAASHHCGRVVFIEEDARAVQALEMNAAERGLSKARIVRSRVQSAWERVQAERPSGRTFLVLDPPRAGLALELARTLAQSASGRMAYLSCDPVTLERDLSVLTGGRWQLIGLEPYDMFPRTRHMEILAILEKPL